jgi:cell division protein FtsZ
MVLGQSEETKKEVAQSAEQKPAPVAEVKRDPLAPTLVEEPIVMQAPVFDFTDIKEVEEPIVHWELLKEPVAEKKEEKMVVAEEINTVGKMWMEEKNETINSKVVTANKIEIEYKEIKESTSLGSAASGGYLARPSNIYTETKAEVYTSIPSEEEPVPLQDVASMEEDSLLDLQMQIVEKDDIQAADVPLAHQIQAPLSTEVEDSALQDETEEQNRRAAERLHKLRNLSFNVNAADPNNEFETVPAYIRRNMELYNQNTHIENFYSSYEVKTDEKNQTHISTINTFLDGKKPD